MPVTKIPLPAISSIEKSFPGIDCSDCHHTTFHARQVITVTDRVRFFFYHWHQRAQLLMMTRNIIMWLFGLTTGKTDGKKKNGIPLVTLLKSGKIAFFNVVEYNVEEVLLSISDKHPDACLSVLANNTENHYEISLSTTKKYTNKLGKVYFFFIMPFQKVIIKTILHRLVNNFSIKY